jgi:hypothetical protein
MMVTDGGGGAMAGGEAKERRSRSASCDRLGWWKKNKIWCSFCEDVGISLSLSQFQYLYL